MAPTPFQLLRDALLEFVQRESELAKAELLPSARQAAIGSGFVAGASAFLLHAIWMLVVTFGFGIGWLLNTFTASGCSAHSRWAFCWARWCPQPSPSSWR